MNKIYPAIRQRLEKLAQRIEENPGITSGELIRWIRKETGIGYTAAYRNLTQLLEEQRASTETLSNGVFGRTRKWYPPEGREPRPITLLGKSPGVRASEQAEGDPRRFASIPLGPLDPQHGNGGPSRA